MAVSKIQGGYETASLSFVTGTDLGTVLKKKNGVVSLSLAWTGSLNTSGDVALCNIPSEYRPKESVQVAVSGRLTNKAVDGRVQTNGTLTIYNNGSAFSDFFYGNLTWII